MRKRALQVLLVVVGLLFFAGLYPLLFWHPAPAEAMLGIVYVTLGAFVVRAVPHPSEHRSLIAFTAWSSLTHAGIMALQAVRNEIDRGDLLRAVLPLAVIGVLLIVLAPAKDLDPARSTGQFEAKAVAR